MSLIVILVALLPAILLWLYIWKKDTRKEPTFLLVKAVLWGMAICIPVALVEMGIQAALFGEEGEPSSIAGTTVMAFIVAALPEETFKLLALWLILRKNPYFDEHFECILYALDWVSLRLKTSVMCLVKIIGCPLQPFGPCWLYLVIMPLRY